MTESVDTDGDPPTGTVDTGRYVYCLISLDDRTSDAPAGFDITGIENEPVSIVTADEGSVGAVVHPRDNPYDSADLTKLRDWLFAHQQVVEEAGDRFGTPLPVQFDTVLNGTNADVTAWLTRNSETITSAFDSLDGCWEYRITLSWDSTAFEATQHEADPKLADIDQRRDQAGEGKRFLLQKQYDQRLRELRQQRRKSLKETFLDRLAEVSIELTERPSRSEAAASLGIELDSDAIAQVAVLAPRSQESSIGEILDEQTELPGVDVRFTGPWPPYTFAPSIGGE